MNQIECLNCQRQEQLLEVYRAIADLLRKYLEFEPPPSGDLRGQHRRLEDLLRLALALERGEDPDQELRSDPDDGGWIKTYREFDWERKNESEISNG